MKLKNFKGDEATIIISCDELAFLHSAIVETRNAVPKNEFRVRTGETLERSGEMLQQLNDILDKIEG
jgi:hypothetical protein